MIKAIETQYQGYRFRSRLEARWAVFFDELGVAWEYEKEGYDLDEAGWYLPDFWLPNMDIWAEVKGVEPSIAERKKAYKLSAMSKKGVLMMQGSPGLDMVDSQYGIADYSAKNTLYCGECFDVYDLPCCYASFSLPWGADRFDSLRQMLCKQSEYVKPEELQKEKFAITDEAGRRSFLVELDKLYFLRKHGRSHPRYGEGRTISVEWKEDIRGQIMLEEVHQSYIQLKHLKPRIIKAHNAARSARFEHGETPHIEQAPNNFVHRMNRMTNDDSVA